MDKFRKLVAIEPLGLTPEAVGRLGDYAEELVFFDDIPQDDRTVADRIGDADAVLLSHTSRITDRAMAACPEIRYIGMCCSLYSPESANVDIIYARNHGIEVSGIRDYGDEGVVEYAVSELVRCRGDQLFFPQRKGHGGGKGIPVLAARSSYGSE